MRRPVNIASPKGRLGVLTPGMGAVSTTFMAGVELVRRGESAPVGSLTQLGTIRLGKRTEGRTPKISEFVPLAKLDDIVFGGWDVFPDDAYQAAAKAGVLESKDLDKVEEIPEDYQAHEGRFRSALRQKFVTALTSKKLKINSSSPNSFAKTFAISKRKAKPTASSWSGAAPLKYS